MGLAVRSGTTCSPVNPIGPCLVEQIDGRSIDIIWGARGRISAALPFVEVQAAEDQGHLVLLD